jgi:MoxR-like ATPase
MNPTVTVSQKQLGDLLLNLALVRPVFVWGQPGIGKSALVQEFAAGIGLPCVSLLGSQLAPEDIIGVPQILDGTSRFCPPSMIARPEPYCLFLDELNACTHEVQKAFYSLIHERRIGDYRLPHGSVVIGAGNRAQDNAIVKTMSSALMNRMLHIHLKASHEDWLEWALNHDIHPLVIEYIQNRPDHLWSAPPPHEEPFSSPRSWHMLSDALKEYGERLTDEYIQILAFASLTPSHAGQFRAFVKQVHHRYQLDAILNGERKWPARLEDRDVLYFLAQSFRAYLVRELPDEKVQVTNRYKNLAYRATTLLQQLASISLEMAQMVVAQEEHDAETLPDWFLVDIVRDMPRLIRKQG